MTRINTTDQKNIIETSNNNVLPTEVNGNAFAFFLQTFSPTNQTKEEKVNEPIQEMEDIEPITEEASDPTVQSKEVADLKDREAADEIKIPPVVESSQALIETAQLKDLALLLHPTIFQTIDNKEIVEERQDVFELEGHSLTIEPEVGIQVFDRPNHPATVEIPATLSGTNFGQVGLEESTERTSEIVIQRGQSEKSNVNITHENNEQPLNRDHNFVDATIELPFRMSTNDLSKRSIPTLEKDIVQAAEKLSQPIVQKVTTMNQGAIQKLTIELLPERLGKVEVTIQVTNEKVQLEFVVQNSQTRQLLESLKPRLEQIMHKQEFHEIGQNKGIETSPIASNDFSQTSFSDHSSFHQNFQQERRQPAFGQQGNKGKSFSEITLEKQSTIENGNIDILA